MSLYRGRLRRYLAWSLIAAGGLLVVHTLHALGRASARATFLKNWRYGPNDFHAPYHFMDAHRVGELAGAGLLEAALSYCDEVDRRKGVGSADILRARIRVQSGESPDEALLTFTRGRRCAGVWYAAIEQLIDVRKARRDYPGACSVLEDLAEGRLRHPALDRIPFPYLEATAAKSLASLHHDLGNGKDAYAWALRAKHEFPFFTSSFCGDPNRGWHDDIEELLVAAAQQQGLTYVAETYDHEVLMRRTLGPGWVEGAVSIALGFAVVFAGLCILTATAGAWPGNSLRWGVLWTRRGILGRIGWGSYLAGFAGCMAVVGEPMIGGNLSSDRRFWMGLLSLAFSFTLVPFLGCFIAEPRPDSSRHFRSPAA